jgi:hypothetical protein
MEIASAIELAETPSNLVYRAKDHEILRRLSLATEGCDQESGDDA